MSGFEVSELPTGHRLEAYGEIASTNALGLDLVARGEAGPLWIVADRQTQGRGRRKRPWVSIEGNLHSSFVVTLDCGPQHIAELGFVAGLACYDAARVVLGDAGALGLKWPNDLLLDGRKTAGILLERAASRVGARECVVIGFGINICGHPEDVGFPATHLEVCQPGIDKFDLMKTLPAAMMHWLGMWQLGAGFDQIRKTWTQRAFGLDEIIAVDLQDRQITGRFMGIDAKGAMLVETSNGEVETIMAGDYRGLVC